MSTPRFHFSLPAGRIKVGPLAGTSALSHLDVTRAVFNSWLRTRWCYTVIFIDQAMLPKASHTSGSLTRSVLASFEARKIISTRHSSTQSTKSESSTPEAKVWMAFRPKGFYILTGFRMKLRKC